jgi:hypothetical protein|tara:strand:- start:2954 stop:3532 length:579 start_codon:yes stop_codon:yes gene_type:complete
MANYFKNIPKVGYDINGTGKNSFLSVTNIMKRVRFKPSVLEDISNYYPYFVKEGERPDIIAHSEYGNVGYAYLILLVNDIQDPNFDWPLSSQVFEKFIINKYGSVSSAISNIKTYYQIIRAEVSRTGTSERVPEVKFAVDVTTYDTLGTSDRKTLSDYDYEVELNDNKGKIRLINPSFIKDIDFQIKHSLKS